MGINLMQVPFSRFGSYFAFSHFYEEGSETSGEHLYLRTVHGGEQRHPLFKIELTCLGESIPSKEEASPTLLRLSAEEGYVEICISEPERILIRGKNVGIRFSKDNTRTFDYALSYRDNMWEVNAYSHRLMLIPLKGGLKVDAPWDVIRCRHIIADFLPDCDSGEIECALEEFETVWKERVYNESFETFCNAVKSEFDSWLKGTLSVPEEYKDERKLAAYVNWASVVKPEGHIKRHAMYMSKNWMTNVWSWDHCFNAMAQIKHNPKFAWDQFVFMIDYQNEDGAFPDTVNDNSIIWNFSKPPIHGWALDWMRKRTDFIGKSQLEGIYDPLCKWTNWWFKFRDYDNDGIPQYNHGNDCGWDNCTAYNEGAPIEGPDLSAFLVIQMEVLSDIAKILGKNAESVRWKERAEVLLQKMLDQLWVKNRFIAPRSGDHKVVFESDSLYFFLPIVLGKRLPEEITSMLVSGLKEERRFLTDFGLATESLGSCFYEPDGYWRGPIWAPSTMLIVDGLASAGEKDFAKEIAHRFCDMIKKGGMAENFNALTGEGLRDCAYTWTSSVFLMLANEYL